MELLYRSPGGVLQGKYGEITKENFKTTCVMPCPLAEHHAAQCLPPWQHTGPTFITCPNYNFPISCASIPALWPESTHTRIRKPN